MKQGDMGIPDVRVLVAFGRVGCALFAARILSFIALVGFLALCFYVVYAPVHWLGVVVCGIAGLVFFAALRAENNRGGDDGQT